MLDFSHELGGCKYEKLFNVRLLMHQSTHKKESLDIVVSMPFTAVRHSERIWKQRRANIVACGTLLPSVDYLLLFGLGILIGGTFQFVITRWLQTQEK